jgi:enterochelin esterase-like enzyme
MVKKIFLWVFAVIGVIAVISICAIWIRMSSGSNDAAPAPISGNTKIEGNFIHSEVLNADRTYSVFLPKSYATDSTRSYPVLYMLHGITDTDRGWFENMHFKDIYDLLVDAGEIDEMIVVMANAGGDIIKDWNGYFDLPEWKYETFYFTEFMPFIEKEYRIIGDRQHRAIAGISMGGGGATSYAQRHSDIFGSVYAMSALMNIPENMDGNAGDNSSRGNASGQQQDTSATQDEAGKKVSRLDMMNQYSKMIKLMASVKENSCIKYVEKANDTQKQQLRSVNWFVDCGDDDSLLDRNIEFVQAMKKAQIPCQFRVGDGGHVWEYWHLSLFNCLKFVSRNFEK